MTYRQDIERFLDLKGIPYRMGTREDGPELVGEPIFEADAILKLADIAIAQPQLEQQSESLYRLLNWAKSTAQRIRDLQSNS